MSSDSRLVFCACICSRAANCASCAVIAWLSIGDVGSWWAICAISSLMNSSLPSLLEPCALGAFGSTLAVRLLTSAQYVELVTAMVHSSGGHVNVTIERGDGLGVAVGVDVGFLS